MIIDLALEVFECSPYLQSVEFFSGFQLGNSPGEHKMIRAAGTHGIKLIFHTIDQGFQSYSNNFLSNVECIQCGPNHGKLIQSGLSVQRLLVFPGEDLQTTYPGLRAIIDWTGILTVDQVRDFITRHLNLVSIHSSKPELFYRFPVRKVVTEAMESMGLSIEGQWDIERVKDEEEWDVRMVHIKGVATGSTKVVEILKRLPHCFCKIEHLILTLECQCPVAMVRISILPSIHTLKC
jgi:hypothetical protein